MQPKSPLVFRASPLQPRSSRSHTSASAQTFDKLTNKAKELAAPITGQTDDRLQKVATFDHQVTGATVSEDGRIFVNFQRWSEDVPVSVAEVMSDGTIKPYPNDERNAWRNARMSELLPKDHFVTVQSVVVDLDGKALVVWIERRSLRHCPGFEHAIKLKPKIVMQLGRIMLLDDEAPPVGRPQGRLAARFLRLLKITFLLVF